MINLKSQKDLKHPGFVLFEGMDFSGKTTISNSVVSKLRDEKYLNVLYHANQGFLNEGLVDEVKLALMLPKEKMLYVLSCYEYDYLSREPKDFVEIIQDRHIPSIIFYGNMRSETSIDEIFNHVHYVNKPKHIFLCETSYDDALIRAGKRKSFTLLERKMLQDSKTFYNMKNIYREIIYRLDVPVTLIDTSKLPEDEGVSFCIDTIYAQHIMDYPINISDLYVDDLATVFPTTVDKRIIDYKNGLKFKPVIVEKILLDDNKYVDILEDGRHRAYASYILGNIQIFAHINYNNYANTMHNSGNVNHSIDISKLVHISEFKFREEIL